MVKRWQEALAFEFVRSAYNYSLPALLDYTHRCLGEDTRGRFGDYESRLSAILTALQECGVRDVLDLAERTSTRPGLEALADLSGLEAHEIAIALQYLSYWFIPAAKPLSSLVRPGSELEAAIQTLRLQGIRSNLEMLHGGPTPLGREQIVESSGLPAAVVEELVQRADLAPALGEQGDYLEHHRRWLQQPEAPGRCRARAALPGLLPLRRGDRQEPEAGQRDR